MSFLLAINSSIVSDGRRSATNSINWPQRCRIEFDLKSEGPKIEARSHYSERYYNSIVSNGDPSMGIEDKFNGTIQ